MDDGKTEIAAIKRRIETIDAERGELVRRLDALERNRSGGPSPLSPEEKIAMFRGLFRGREDVYSKRWMSDRTGRSGYSPVCANEWQRGVCEKPRIKCTDCPNQAFVTISNDAVRRHLSNRNGEDTIGVYPLLPDERCWFLATDFDKKNWREDTAAFIRTCRAENVPAYVERSRSGNGAHVWMFFSAPAAASDARTMGAYLLTETMDHHADLDFASYDRFFPNQDHMPKGGFGSLIALPLQYGPRRDGNSVFVDDDFNPYADQWLFLQSIRRMSPEEVRSLALRATESGRVTGLRIPVEHEDSTEPWKSSPSGKSDAPRITAPIPEVIRIIAGNQLYIDKSGLPQQLINRLIRTAAFQNPEYFRAQALRLPLFDKPRVIACAENFPRHVGLPRGCLDEVVELLDSLNIRHEIVDERYSGEPIRTRFLGTLNMEQQSAAKAVLRHDIGVLSATTGFGKTVLAAHVIAKRKKTTLILVHRKHLLDQWLAQLHAFLDTEHLEIGRIGGGKRKPGGAVDIALIQSLVHGGAVDDCVAEYGQIIIDECHHLSAVSFESAVRSSRAKYVLGLTATPIRRDGRHPIIFMQCGPLRYRVSAKKQADKRRFSHFVIPRYTDFQLSAELVERYKHIPIQAVYGEIANNDIRNRMIIDDVVSAVNNNRSPIIITERKAHVTYFSDHLSGAAEHIVVLQGGMGSKADRAIHAEMERIKDDASRILIATGPYIGEGFDDARLDTLFLAMPISWKGTLTQYAGRLHRNHHNKKEVIIYDYTDHRVPLLERMSAKRITGYKNLGYEILKENPGGPAG